MAVINNAKQVTEQLCFINSPNKITAGILELKEGTLARLFLAIL